MKIFVTGASGFVGRAFCREAIKRGHQILALSRHQKTQLQPDVEMVVGTLADTPWKEIEAFSPDAALHLAWIAEPGIYLESPENVVLLEQSKLWFQRLFELGVSYIAGTGTCIEYAPSLLALHETSSPLSPRYPYSKAKVELWEWLNIHAHYKRAWFRIFFPYGAGEHSRRFTSSMVTRLRQNKPVIMNTPESVRDYVEIRDVAAGILTAFEHQITGPINIGSGSGITIATIADAIARLTNADPSLVQRNPKADIDPYPVIIANMNRLESVGWRPSIGLANGLQSLINSLL